MIVTTNPATGEELARYELHDDAFVDAALSAAAKTQKAGARSLSKSGFDCLAPWPRCCVPASRAMPR